MQRYVQTSKENRTSVVVGGMPRSAEFFDEEGRRGSCGISSDRWFETLYNNSIWRELHGRELSKTREALNSSSPEERNQHFAAVSISEQARDYSHSSIISSAVFKLFNSCLGQRHCPAVWENSHIIPLKNCLIPSSTSDCWPIAILSFLLKILKISEFIEHNRLLGRFHSEFRPHHFTPISLVKLT